MKRFFIIDCALLSLAIALLLCIGIGTFFSGDDSFSEEENRPLSSFPEFSTESLMDGAFFQGLGSFYSDRIPCRLSLVRLKSAFEMALGKEENNGVLLLDDGTLVQRCEYESTALLEKNLRTITASGTMLVAVPRSVDIYLKSEESEHVRNTVFTKSADGELLYSKLCAANGRGEQVYYKTDHHLSYDGAYELYALLCESFGVTPYPKDDFSKQLVSDSFWGTSYSKSGALATEADSVYLPRYDGDTELEVHCLDSGCTLNSLYDHSFLTKKDKYSVFLGGNHGTLTVKSSAEQDRPHLLLIKDSFANAVIPMLARHFDITVRDPRYDTSPISGEYDAALVVCGIDTLATTPFSFSIEKTNGCIQ